jgi:hypothetical protein
MTVTTTRFGLLALLWGTLAGCSTMGGSITIGSGYSNYYDPWRWGPGHYHPPTVVPPGGPAQKPPAKPEYPIGRPPARPTPLPAARPPPRPQPRPAAGSRRR